MALALLLVACGGSDATAPTTACPTPTNGQMTASVNGAAFAASTLLTATIQNSAASGPNIVQVNGLECTTSAGVGRQLLITVGRLTPITPGTYPLDPASLGVGGYSGIGQLSRVPSLWYSSIRDGTTAGSGSITFTVVTATRVAGTFQFNAVPASSNGSADRQVMAVTNGSFDITVR